MRTETFEWRHSTGEAVRRTGRRSGYKLVRLSTDAGDGAGGELATGGGEVLAVIAGHAGPRAWVKGIKGPKGMGRLRASGVFMFQGSGAQGVLGEEWQLVAVVTAMGIWDYRRRLQQLMLG